MWLKPLIAMMGAVAAGCAGAAPPVASSTPAAPIEIISAEFGIFDAGTPGELVFEPTRVIPHVVAQRYGWVIEVGSAQRSLAVREEYLFAAPAAATPPVDDDLTPVVPRRSQVSQRQLVPAAGKIYGEWSIGPGEPAGRRTLQVVIENQLGARFEFEVK